MVLRLFLVVSHVILLAVGAIAATGGMRVALAADSAEVRITARCGAHPAFDRLVLDGPRGESYTVSRDGSRVIVRFSLPATLDLHGVSGARLARMSGFSGDASERRSVSFSIAPNAIVKDYVNGASYVVDVYGATADGADSAVKPVQKQVEQKIPEKKQADKKIETPAVAADSSSSTAKPAVAAVISAAKSQLPDVGTSPELVLTLDPKADTGAAIYARGGYCYFMFDRKLSLDAAALTGGAATATRVKLEPLNLPRNSGFRFAIPPDVTLRATRVNTAWQIYLSKRRDEIAVSTELVAQPEFALGPRLLLPTGSAPEPIRFTDPVVGDDLIILPLRETLGFASVRRLSDVVIEVTAQGLLVKPMHEKVAVRAVSEGVEITAQGGLKLSNARDSGVLKQSAIVAKSAVAGKSLFDFTGWRGRDGESFTAARQRLTQTVVDVPEMERNRARLDLARFYFAHGMGAESLALMSFLSQQVPDIATHSEFLLLRGAAHILANQAQSGLSDLSDSQLTDQQEVELWQAVAAAQLRDWQTADEKFALTADILAGYPEPFYSRFAVLSIEAALAVDKDHEAADWLDRLESHPHADTIDPALRYLRGVINGKAGRAEVAGNLWKDVSHSNDRLYKIRAEMALIDLGVATHSLTPQQAAERLEGLRFAWRGDDLELDILHRLGGFYIDAHKFRDGLSVLKQAIRLYPDSPLSPVIHSEMAKTFHDVFMGDMATDMSPVDALTLYQDFRDLMPSGEDGDAIGRNLAERLVAIDLLDQATNILEDQVKNRLQGETKAKTGTRLAAIRLLDHKADGAIAALEVSQIDKMPDALQTERQLLRARALSEQHKTDEALALLQGMETLPARMLKADIAMRAQRWGDAAKALQNLIGAPPNAGEAITADQAQWLVNCAIAMSLADDSAGLDKLAIDYGAAMSAMPQNDTFRVLTRPEKETQMRDIAAAQSKISEVDMFRSFLDAYRVAPPSDKPDGNKVPAGTENGQAAAAK